VLIVQTVSQYVLQDLPIKVISYSSLLRDKLTHIGYCLFVLSLVLTTLIFIYKCHYDLMNKKLVVIDITIALTFLIKVILNSQFF